MVGSVLLVRSENKIYMNNINELARCYLSVMILNYGVCVLPWVILCCVVILLRLRPSSLYRRVNPSFNNIKHVRKDDVTPHFYLDQWVIMWIGEKLVFCLKMQDCLGSSCMVLDANCRERDLGSKNSLMVENA
jgi:hypothetical protein